LDEIEKTHSLLAYQLAGLLKTVPDTIQSSVKPNVDSFFETAEGNIHAFIDQITGQLNGQDGAYPSGTNVAGVDNAGSTTRSAFPAGPRDGSRPAQSKSVQCTWGMRKVSQGQSQATVTPATASGGLAAGAGLSQDLRDFVSTFAARIKGDGDLSQQF